MNVTNISAPDFIKLCQQNQHNNDEQALCIVDLRTSAEVASESIGHSVNIPVQALEEATFHQAIAKREPQDVYLLCQSGRRAEMAVDKLTGKTEHNLVIIEGGLNALKAAGLTVKKGNKNVISLERQVRIAAGLLTITGVALGALVNPYWYGLSAFVGAGLMFAGITDTCGMALMLAKMPWNQVKS